LHYLLEKYYKMCRELTEPYGFKKRGQAFVRVVNDVMQNFLIERIGSDRECRITFAVLPLCMRIEKEYIKGGVYSRELRRFEPAVFPSSSDGWDYDSRSIQSMDTCVAEIARFLGSYLLPFFEHAKSSQTALPELQKLSYLFRETRLKGLQLSGMEDRSDGLPQLLYTEDIYFMALKNGDYDLALQCKRRNLTRAMANYQSMLEKECLTPENKAERERRIANLETTVERLVAHETDYFQQLLSENEEYSKVVLKELFYTKERCL